VARALPAQLERRAHISESSGTTTSRHSARFVLVHRALVCKRSQLMLVESGYGSEVGFAELACGVSQHSIGCRRLKGFDLGRRGEAPGVRWRIPKRPVEVLRRLSRSPWRPPYYWRMLFSHSPKQLHNEGLYSGHAILTMPDVFALCVCAAETCETVGPARPSWHASPNKK